MLTPHLKACFDIAHSSFQESSVTSQQQNINCEENHEKKYEILASVCISTQLSPLYCTLNP
jgi:hypothetical protein